MLSILSWIIFGLIAGAIAKALHPGKDPGGWIITIILGIAGAFVGGWVGSQVLGFEINSNWSFKGFLFAVGGAFLLLLLYRLVSGKKA